MNFLEKPVDQLTLDDVRSLIPEMQEGPSIDFKRALSADDGAPDPWQTGANKIGDRAKAALAKQIVAFANAQGGTVVLGMDESKDKPSRAAEILPVRDVIALAERLRRSIRDSIEPAIHGFEVRGIPVDGDGNGVVVLRVAGSPYGPHRSRIDKECYIRRNDDAMPMTMEEIQRRTIEMSQRLEHIDEWFRQQHPKAFSDGWVIRAVARPLGPLFVPGIYRSKVAKPKLVPITIRMTAANHLEAELRADGLNWTPRVRGASFLEEHGGGHSTSISVFEDGSLCIDWRAQGPYEDGRKIISTSSFIAVFGNMLLGIERLRLASKQASDYAAEVHLVCNDRFIRYPYRDNFHGLSNGAFGAQSSILGRYEVGNSDTFAELTKIFETDVHHLSGVDNTDSTSFDYSEQLSRLRSEFGIT